MPLHAARDRGGVVMAGAACLQEAGGPRQTGKFVWTAGKLSWLAGWRLDSRQVTLDDDISIILPLHEGSFALRGRDLCRGGACFCLQYY
jgi:hypothetical protein